MGGDQGPTIPETYRLSLVKGGVSAARKYFVLYFPLLVFLMVLGLGLAGVVFNWTFPNSILREKIESSQKLAKVAAADHQKGSFLEPLVPELVHSVLLWAAIVLLIVNTFLFGLAVLKQAEDSEKKCPERPAALLLTFIALVGLVVWAFRVPSLGPTDVFEDEAFAVGVFVVFALIDLVMRRGCSKMQSVSKGRVARSWLREAGWHSRQFWCVDVPPLAGILGIILLQWIILPRVPFWSPMSGNGLTPRQLYGFTFGSGALLMHLILSQLVYVALAVDYEKQKFLEAEQSGARKGKSKSGLPLWK